jgi:hypothetical protein
MRAAQQGTDVSNVATSSTAATALPEGVLFGPEVPVLIGLTAIYHLGYAVGFMPDVFWTFFVPASLGCALIYGALHLFQSNPIYVMTAYFWFLVTTACFYGVGGAAMYLGTDTTIQVIQSFYNFSDEEFRKTHIVVATSLMVTVVVANLVMGRRLPYDGGEVFKTPEGMDLRTIGLVALLIGLSVELTIDLPYQFGLIEETSGLRSLTAIVFVGIVILSYVGFGGDKIALTVAAGVTLFQIIIGLLLFQKMPPIVAIVVFSVGWIIKRPKVQNAFIVVLAIMVTYTLLAPFSGYARNELILLKGERGGTIADRLEVTLQYIEESAPEESRSDDYQPWLARLSYLNAQAFAVSAFDAGRPATSLDNLIYVFVPRAIMPDKPIISDVGADFNQAVNGNRNSASSPTIPVEVYYLYGWFGVLFLTPVYAAILGLYSRLSVSWLSNSKIFFFPAVFMMMLAGMQNDNSLISSTFGGGVIIAVASVACAFGQKAIEFAGAHLAGTSNSHVTPPPGARM